MEEFALVIGLFFGWWIGSVFSLPVIGIITALIGWSLIDDGAIYIFRKESGAFAFTFDRKQFTPPVLSALYVWLVAAYVRGWWSSHIVATVWEFLKPWILRS